MKPANAPLLLTNAICLDPSSGTEQSGGVLVIDGKIAALGSDAQNQGAPDGATLVDCGGKYVAPGLIDILVDVGEPGGEHRETLSTASQAALAGGITTLVTTPDSDPVIDDPSLVDFLNRRARDTADVRVYPLAALTREQAGTHLSEFGLILEAGAVGFSSGQRAVTNAQVMRNALSYARDFDAVVCHHTEDPDLVGAGVVNEGGMAQRLGLPGIPSVAETVMIDRDLRLVELTGARYHAQQLSTAASVEAIRRAKHKGLPVTAGVSVNHLSLNELDVGSYRTFFRMSPPLRHENDRQALIEGLADGTIDTVFSAHNPQDVEGKRHPFADTEPGAVGLETAFAAAMRLVHSGDISLSILLRAMSQGPAQLCGLEGGKLGVGTPADLMVFDPELPWVVSADKLLSKSKNTAFEDARMTGKVIHTVVAGQLFSA